MTLNIVTSDKGLRTRYRRGVGSDAGVALPGRKEVNMEIVELIITERNLKVKWHCPSCKKINAEYYNDDGKNGKKKLCCYGCGAKFEGEIKE